MNTKLAFLPTAYKTSKLYSVLPNDGTGDFSFIRATSATRVDKDGLIETVGNNVPRLDYSGGGCPTLLLETESTNYVPYSEDFTDASWGKFSGGTGSSPIVTGNYGISPDGTQNADRIEFDKGIGTGIGDSSFVSYTTSLSTGLDTCKSVYIKSNTSLEYDMIIYAGNALNNNRKKITVTNEWQRFDIYAENEATTPNLSIGLRERNVTGLSNTADVLVWGAQIEEGITPSSYIPNNGNTAGETRNADTGVSTSDMSGSIDFSNGFIWETQFDNISSGSEKRYTISDGTNANRLMISTLTGGVNLRIVSPGVDLTDNGIFSVDLNSPINLKVKVLNGDLRIKYNGAEVYSNTINFDSTNLNTVKFSSATGLFHFHASVNSVKISTDLTTY